MKTIEATTEPASPVVKFVANVWHRAHQTEAQRISLSLHNSEFKLSVGDTDWESPPSKLFSAFVTEFLRYAGVRVWPWTNAVRRKPCSVNADGTKRDWFMESENIKQSLTIERD